MADNNQNPEEQTAEVTEQSASNGQNQATNENGESEVKADIKPEDETKEDKAMEEGGLINATEDNESKMFVGGLSWDTETFGLKDYFSKFGEVKDCTIKKDSKTERSRGFGFVLFADPASVQKVMDCPSHYLDGRKIDPKRAQALRKDGKMFVGGIKPETDNETVKEYFSKFGEIEQYERPSDKVTKKLRGFCFITFKKDGILRKCCAEKNQTLDGATIEVKEAQSQDRKQMGMGRGGGNFGGGRGGWMGPNYGPGYGYPQYGYDMGYDYGGGFGGAYGNPAGYGNYNAGFHGGAYGGGGQGGFGKAPRRGMGGHANSYKPY